MNFDILAVLKLAIAFGLIFTAGIWVFYFWFKREERKKNDRTNEKLDIF